MFRRNLYFYIMKKGHNNLNFTDVFNYAYGIERIKLSTIHYDKEDIYTSSKEI